MSKQFCGTAIFVGNRAQPIRTSVIASQTITILSPTGLICF